MLWGIPLMLSNGDLRTVFSKAEAHEYGLSNYIFVNWPLTDKSGFTD